jgi:hypothetical protein
MSGDDLTRIRTEMSTAVVDLLRSQGMSMSDLGRRLSVRAREHGLGRGGGGIRYDAANVKRWQDGSAPLSRQAAWLLDHMGTGQRPVFQELRDRYILLADRQLVSQPAGPIDDLLVQGARCSADIVMARRARRPLVTHGAEKVAYLFLSVVDCEDARDSIRKLVEEHEGVRIVAMYSLLGRWDLVGIFAVGPNVDFTAFQATLHDELVAAELVEPVAHDSDRQVGEHRQREFTARRAVIAQKTINPHDESTPPKYLVLPDSRDYDRFRVQRAFLFVELRTVARARRSRLSERLTARLSDPTETSSRIVEAVVYGSDALLIEVLMTCADSSRLNELNRLLVRDLSYYVAKKYSLVVYDSDEEGWLAEPFPAA